MDAENEAGPTEPEAEGPPLWQAEEWKPGRWIVVKGPVGPNRLVHGPTFGSSATVFDTEEEATSTADRLNEEKE